MNPLKTKNFRIIPQFSKSCRSCITLNTEVPEGFFECKRIKANDDGLPRPSFCFPPVHGNGEYGKAASNAKRDPLCENRRFPLSRKPTVSCLLRLRPNPRRTRFPCSETQDKSCGCAIFQIALWRSAQRWSASFSFVVSGSSWTSSVPRKRSILALAVSSSFMSSRALRYSE